VTQGIYTPIQSDATMLAALIAGDVDFINPVPIQNVERLQNTDGMNVIIGKEARVMMLGFPHEADTLTYDGSPNPFADVRVREAVYRAINVDAINTTIMRGAVEPVAQLVTPDMRGYSQGLSQRLDYDPDAARALLAEAGYGDGFTFSLMCPNDRYINDAAVCQAVVGMLAQVGITVDLNTMPVANYWPELRADNFDMYLLGWSPGTFDAEHPIRFLVATPNEELRLGSWNLVAIRMRASTSFCRWSSRKWTRARVRPCSTRSRRSCRTRWPMCRCIRSRSCGVCATASTVTPRSDNFFILRWVSIDD
jgi:peptide/nickel transport system substrate-binding protein